MSINKDIETILNLPKTPKPVVEPKEGQVEVMEKSEIDTDFDLARGNIQLLLSEGHQLFDLAKIYAESAESTNAFEVATQLLKALTTANKDLLELHEKKKKVTAEKVQDIQIDKAVFVGTTADLQKSIESEN